MEIPTIVVNRQQERYATARFRTATVLLCASVRLRATLLSRYLQVFALTGLAALALTRDSLHAQNPATVSSTTTVDFTRDIQPILESRCYGCHGPKNAANGLRLDRRAAAIQGGESGPAIIPGNSGQSLMVRRLLGLDGQIRMPKVGDPLSIAQIALIRGWIDQGARWPENSLTADSSAQHGPGHSQHWAYQAPDASAAA